MSTPENTSEAQSTDNTTAPTFEQRVSEVIKQFTQDDSGKTILPEGLVVDESVRYAAMAEKRRRDTESALGKATQKLRAEEATRKELEKRVAGQISMTPDEQYAMEELKYADPEAWRRQANDFEQRASTSLQEELSIISSNASQQAELERRTQVLTQFNYDNSDYPITDEALAQDIPPRITKKLAEGKVSFEDFLMEAHAYLAAPKKVGGGKLSVQPNLGSMGGGSEPSDEARAASEMSSYKDTVF